MSVYPALDMSDPVVKLIIAARVKLFFRKPFFGHLAARLILVDASSWCKTAATDGRHLFYNREFIKSLDPKRDELLFLLGHEVLHCALDHLGRRGGRDPKLWNVSNDYIINWILTEEQCGHMPRDENGNPRGLYDKRFTDANSSEEVYNILEKEKFTLDLTLDEHLDMPGDGQGSNDGDGKSATVHVMGGQDGPPKLTADDLQQIRNEVKAAMIQAAQSVGAGNVPAGLRRMLDSLITPMLDWRALLDAHVRSSARGKYTFNRPSRRSMAMGASGIYRQVPILPARDPTTKVKVAVGIDTSGSMTEEMLRDMLSETKGIMQTFPDFELDLWTFDTEIYEPKRFTPQNIDEIDTYPMLGGGGTMFECNWEYMKQVGLEPERFIMFTDGMPCSTWGDENYCDTLFVIHGNTNIKAPFGLTCYYEKKPAMRQAA